MKIAFVTTDTASLEQLLVPYKSAFNVVTDNPDVVVLFGGDGTLMIAEHKYPTVPKLFLKNSKIAKLGPKIPNEDILTKFFSGKYTLTEHMKLRFSIGDTHAEALNDIVIHNENPRHAIRYIPRVNENAIYEEVIGDGTVCATPLGSTGYYRSITDSVFETGIGLAFNNSTEQTDHIVLKEDSVVSIEITRGPAFCYADNQEESYPLKTGDILTIQKSEKNAKIVFVAN
jgi:NAD kinase